jgi:hypothetical protein
LRGIERGGKGNGKVNVQITLFTCFAVGHPLSWDSLDILWAKKKYIEDERKKGVEGSYVTISLMGIGRVRPSNVTFCDQKSGGKKKTRVVRGEREEEILYLNCSQSELFREK